MLRNLPSSGGQPGETRINTAYALRGKAGDPLFGEDLALLDEPKSD